MGSVLALASFFLVCVSSDRASAAVNSSFAQWDQKTSEFSLEPFTTDGPLVTVGPWVLGTSENPKQAIGGDKRDILVAKNRAGEVVKTRLGQELRSFAPLDTNRVFVVDRWDDEVYLYDTEQRKVTFRFSMSDNPLWDPVTRKRDFIPMGADTMFIHDGVLYMGTQVPDRVSGSNKPVPPSLIARYRIAEGPNHGVVLIPLRPWLGLKYSVQQFLRVGDYIYVLFRGVPKSPVDDFLAWYRISTGKPEGMRQLPGGGRRLMPIHNKLCILYETTDLIGCGLPHANQSWSHTALPLEVRDAQVLGGRLWLLSGDTQPPQQRISIWEPSKGSGLQWKSVFAVDIQSKISSTERPVALWLDEEIHQKVFVRTNETVYSFPLLQNAEMRPDPDLLKPELRPDSRELKVAKTNLGWELSWKGKLLDTWASWTLDGDTYVHFRGFEKAHYDFIAQISADEKAVIEYHQLPGQVSDAKVVHDELCFTLRETGILQCGFPGRRTWMYETIGKNALAFAEIDGLLWMLQGPQDEGPAQLEVFVRNEFLGQYWTKASAVSLDGAAFTLGTPNQITHDAVAGTVKLANAAGQIQSFSLKDFVNYPRRTVSIAWPLKPKQTWFGLFGSY